MFFVFQTPSAQHEAISRYLAVSSLVHVQSRTTWQDDGMTILPPSINQPLFGCHFASVSSHKFQCKCQWNGLSQTIIIRYYAIWKQQPPRNWNRIIVQKINHSSEKELHDIRTCNWTDHDKHDKSEGTHLRSVEWTPGVAHAAWQAPWSGSLREDRCHPRRTWSLTRPQGMIYYEYETQVT